LKDKIIQHSLFDCASSYKTSIIPAISLEMSKESLMLWREKIINYQNQAKLGKLTTQSNLFELANQSMESLEINPFELPLKSMQFYRLPIIDQGSASIYFIIDNASETILYIGETCHSNKRWKGNHDCKRYIQNYQNLHYSHGIKTSINAAFWLYAPIETRERQKIELDYIYHWRSPFNKEIWQYWGTPFTN
jgi:hypothetical protein